MCFTEVTGIWKQIVIFRGFNNVYSVLWYKHSTIFYKMKLRIWDVEITYILAGACFLFYRTRYIKSCVYLGTPLSSTAVFCTKVLNFLKRMNYWNRLSAAFLWCLMFLVRPYFYFQNIMFQLFNVSHTSNRYQNLAVNKMRSLQQSFLIFEFHSKTFQNEG